MTAALAARRHWLAPEVVQTSSMDCGPAALKCLLEGHGIPASYGRLREACQTDVDGTSIDTLEGVARQLGLQAEQVMVPADHVALPLPEALPALVVVRHADLGTHFVVVWRRVGPWVQIMDPAGGRRWESLARLRQSLYPHETGVDAADWRAWAASDEYAAALQQRLAAIGVRAQAAQRLHAAALKDARWFLPAALDAAVRLVQALVRSGGVSAGADSARLVKALVRGTRERTDDIFALVPQAYWSVVPDATNTDPTRERLRLRGAVLLQIAGRRDPAIALAEDEAPASPELLRAMQEKTEHPMATAWRLLREDGLLAPIALLCAVLLATGAVLFETLLFRGLFDLSAQLALASQRLGAVLGLLAFLAVLLAVELPIVLETLRLGRHLETRLRLALLQRLPQLHDRYFQSRPISDMADRSHGIPVARGVPQLALQGLQTLLELGLTLAAMLWLAPASAGWTLALAATALAVPLAIQPLLNERDLRVRNHAGALNGFYLDALLGLVPVRVHRAEGNVRRQHESLMVEWAASLRGSIQLTLTADTVQGLLGVLIAAGLMLHHFSGAQGVGGADLLLVFWTLKLPALGHRLAGLAHQYPAQRNALLRLLEPLSAPQQPAAGAAQAAPAAAAGAKPAPAAATEALPGLALHIDGGSVRAGGHTILRDIDLAIAPGEHVAIVGASGAGKSSLIGALLGWHHLAEGRLRVDGVAVPPEEIDALRRVTAWVDPAIQLWNRSLVDNLMFASPDDDLQRIGPALLAARLEGVAQKLPQGLQSLLGEGGARLSGGEGQRVRLGRALLARGVRLALLDEPFRGLDREQRKALLAEARQWWRQQTLLCVTHDVGETLGFDRVLVVDDGRIVEDGRPAQLARQDSRYRALLTAEADLRRQLWGGGDWRRLQLRDGRLHETARSAG